MSQIIGGGALAERFRRLDSQREILIFAPNSEDSQRVELSVVEEESNELRRMIQTHPASTVVYFSSCSALDVTLANSDYVIYKRAIEELIQSIAPSYLIIRLPQVISRQSAATNLSRFLVEKTIAGEPFEIWSGTERNFIDIDDVYEIVREILNSEKFLNQVVNVANPNSVSMIDFVQIVEASLGVSAKYQITNKQSQYEIDVSAISGIIDALKIDFDETYISRTILKYYGYRINGPKLLSIIVPTFNEELGINEFYYRTKAVLALLSPHFDHEIIFVNDASSDGTQYKLRQLAKIDERVKVLKFSRNFGNQAGITAGINIARGDVAVIIDDDLQDPPEVILEMLAQWYKGHKVVYAVRRRRKSINPILRVGAWCFYRLLSRLSNTNIPRDTGDFRLIDQVVIQSLRNFGESNRYLRGLVAWVGFSQYGIKYDRDARYAGETKFTLKKYIKFAIDGLTSFSEKPLTMISGIGFVITILSGFAAVGLIILRILDFELLRVSGWTSLMVVVLFLGGVQIFSIGIVGVYLSNVLAQVKNRPIYIVEESINT